MYFWKSLLETYNQDYPKTGRIKWASGWQSAVLYIVIMWSPVTQAEANSVSDYTIAGLPMHNYRWENNFKNATMTKLHCAGTVGFIFTPKGRIDPERRWVWIGNIYCAFPWDQRNWNIFQQWYIEKFLDAGFHVVGIDVGVTAGSPAGAEVFQKFYEMLIRDYKLNPKARLTAQSNGGLIVYGWAFRYPNEVDRILGILPATDMRSWPGLNQLCPPGDIVTKGLSYGLSCEELQNRLREFNPIDNLAPLAKAGVKIYHIHGDTDAIVPIKENTIEFQKRYQALGGEMEVELIPGGNHGEPEKSFFESREALKFLLVD